MELRSNLTIRNTLRVKAHLLFERLHTAGEEGRHEYQVGVWNARWCLILTVLRAHNFRLNELSTVISCLS